MAIARIDADGRISDLSPHAVALTQGSYGEIVGRPLVEMAAAWGASEAELERVRGAVEDGVPAVYDATRVLAAGAPVAFSVIITPLVDGGGAVTGATLVATAAGTPATPDNRAQLLIDASRMLGTGIGVDATLEQVVDLLVDDWVDSAAIALVDDEGGLRFAARRDVNPARTALADVMAPAGGPPPPGGLLAETLAAGTVRLLDADDGDPAMERAVEAFDLQSVLLIPLVARERTVGLLVATTSRATGRRIAPDLAALLGTVAERAAQAIDQARLIGELRGAETRFRAAFDHAPIGIALLRIGPGLDARYTEVNSALCSIFGYARDDIVGAPLTSFAHPDDRADAAQRVAWLDAADVGEVSAERRHVRPDGEVRWLAVRAAPVQGDLFVVQYQDITEQRQFQDQLEHLASRDALTGLLNRRRFEEDLSQTLALVRRHGDGAAVITIDVDNFKHVNDTYGHAVGDELLRAVAEALTERTRLTDIVGRLGGDEFGVILLRAGHDEARAVARTLIEAIRRLGITVGERTVRVTASAGLRALEPGEERTAGELLSDADMAMYDAKEHGRDRIAIIRPGDEMPDRLRARVRWFERIREALETPAGFVLYEQPIVRLADNVIDRSELLIRLVGEAGEPIAPGAFLGIAERYGQMLAIDRWVIRSAIDLLAGRADAGAELAVEVNLSGESMSDASAIDFIVAEIRNAGIDPRCLTFEVTETTAISNLERARQLARRLSDLGCRFALDDFGTGFASFAYLKHLPLDVIKIDGEFVRSLPRSRHDQVTVQAIVDMARGLGKETVAEFVEDEETLRELRRLGVDRAQGYHVGRPRPAAVQPRF